ncbi:MAG TPA: VOC family protein [Stackebrandtia sp.]|jgi:predicted 3-demethylubiquinone-9 3-methyltransferase (glyoxalase superfamily)|uniref:VOC family protein n=1 Tax=Stackebrandtia sp. TaxID=2023065 RepID=UPI002D2BF207|nr:VOC family protein [Stackebrandtia sp.]HZE37426.1 VOC family protein [Stackebrandtia sp.]
MTTFATCLWFDDQAEPAAAFYTSLFDDARIVETMRYGKEAGDRADTVMTVVIALGDQRYTFLNGGTDFTLNEAASIEAHCADQAEIDRLWEALTADGGSEGPCGWLKDRFGVSWQIVPAEFMEMLRDPDSAKVQRATQAMFQMKKLDIAALREAFEG